MSRGIVTLTTDFGSSDSYVGIMKGVILGINPDAQVVDICHDIRPYDLLEAAYTIAQAYRYFPPRSVHIVLVDPGVGTPRRPILASADRHVFVAPDNGVLSLMYGQEPDVQVRHISATHYFREPVSNTFHGRDIFAPVAAWLSRRVETEKFGEPINDYLKLAAPQPQRVSERLTKGMVVRVDRFGTLITNLTRADLPGAFGDNPAPFKMTVGQTEITKLNKAYADGAQGEVFAIVGSAGYLEIAANRASAAQALGVGKGAEVGVIINS